jgi:HAMP domain-containing protein
MSDQSTQSNNELLWQSRAIGEVITAIANGDFMRKVPLEAPAGATWNSEQLEVAKTLNRLVDQLNQFAGEATRVSREMGSEGIFGGQMWLPDATGTWKDLTDNFNSMGRSVTMQMRVIALVTTSVANGDLSRKMSLDIGGEVGELQKTINAMVDQLNQFASEATRISRETGVEGRFGGQMEVDGVTGVWKDLTSNINLMASSLTNQVRDLASVTTAVANGDLSRKVTVGAQGEMDELKLTINVMIDQLNSFASQVTRLARELGTEGNLGGQIEVRGASGVWQEMTDNLNIMATNLTTQVRGISQVVTFIANGDFDTVLVVESNGEVAALKDKINSLTEMLSAFAGEVTRVAREMGTEGIFGGSVQVPKAAGTWKDVTDNINGMTNSLTVQIRSLSDTVKATIDGDTSRQVTVQAQGEMLELRDALNVLIERSAQAA